MDIIDIIHFGFSTYLLYQLSKLLVLVNFDKEDGRENCRLNLNYDVKEENTRNLYVVSNQKRSTGDERR